GPLESSPKTGARVGRNGDDNFATAGRPRIARPLMSRPSSTPPHFLVSSGPLPQVQTTDPEPAGFQMHRTVEQDLEPNNDSGDLPAVAERPGLSVELPTR
ncbi:MAG TPA: hypothetical protein VFW73_13650, partial [Lacipirellulaceae bacterium]|nr:hypothetical protein [Lacipirellulaceae bacterium]